MQSVLKIFSVPLKALHAIYISAFNANNWVAGIGFSVLITTVLFSIMVLLISLGDSGIKEDKSVKLADIVMPERQIETFMTEVDKPEKPDEQPEDIAQPDVDLQPLAGLDVTISKPKAQKMTGGSFFRDGEYIPLFKVTPIYPRRAQERGTQGYALVRFTITDSGTVEDVVPVEGMCGDPQNPETEFRPCTMFNSASARAALKLKYKPKVVDGKATSVEDVLHRFTFVLAEDD
jgi:protein TonB